MLGFRTKEVIVAEDDGPSSIEAIRQVLGIPGTRSVGFVESIPFAHHDATAGSETELQAAVSGSKECVDLPIVIESSNYFANIMRRVRRGGHFPAGRHGSRRVSCQEFRRHMGE